MHKGYSLFSEIWTDQPPVLTFILAGAKSFFPRNIIVSRGIILIFSGLLLWALFRILHQLEGRACAWLSSAALVAIEGYRDLSVSVMIGLPAVALAAAAMDQTIAAAVDQKKYRYWIAGILYAVSLQTKMFTSILFPALVLAVFLDLSSGQLASWRTRALNFARLILSTLASFLAIAAVSGEPIFAQLVAPHFQPGVASEFARQGGIQYMTNLLAEHIPFAVASLFIAGSWVCVRGWKTRYAIPILWLSSAGLVFSVHRPLFDHHLLLFYVPIAWLSSLSDAFVRKCQPQNCNKDRMHIVAFDGRSMGSATDVYTRLGVCGSIRFRRKRRVDFSYTSPKLFPRSLGSR